MTDSAFMFATWYAWIGKRVCINGIYFGTLRYFGELKFNEEIWCGVELDEPLGENDGMANNVRYFNCKSKHGIFVPVYDTVRLTSEITEDSPSNCRPYNLPKFHSAIYPDKFVASEKVLNSNFCPPHVSTNIDEDTQHFQKISNFFQSANLDLNKTFDIKKCKNSKELKLPSTSLKEEAFDTISVDPVKCESIPKKSKDTFGRLDTEESLGILPDFLDEDESWDLLHSEFSNQSTMSRKSLMQNSDEMLDSVFIPAVVTIPNSCVPCPNSDTSLLPSCITDIKYTSTPKQCFSSTIDLNATVKLEQNQSYDFLPEDESTMEFIIAGSNKPSFEINYDLNELNPILCSTSKISPPSLQIQYPILNEISVINNEDENLKCKHILNPREEKCVNTEEFTEIFNRSKQDNVDILSTTFEIKSSKSTLNSPVAVSSLINNSNPYSVSDTNDLLTNRKCNGGLIQDLNSTFVMYKDTVEIDSNSFVAFNPIKIVDKMSSVEPSQIHFNEQVLNTIPENHSSENDSEIDVFEDTVNELTSHKKTVLSTEFSKERAILQVNSSVCMEKTPNKPEITSELNSTFCITGSGYKSKENLVCRDFKKRYSLSAINNTTLQSDKTEFKKPYPISSKLSIRKSISYLSSSIIKKSNSFSKSRDISSKHSKNSQDQPSIPHSSENLILPRNIKKKCINQTDAFTANHHLQQKGASDSCKSGVDLIAKKQRDSNVTSTITETDLPRVNTRYKSAASLQAKTITKISCSNSLKRSSISKFQTPNQELKMKIPAYNFNAENHIDGKLCKTIKSRLSISKTVPLNGVCSKNNVCKSESLKIVSIVNPIPEPLLSVTDNKNVHPLKFQAGFGKKKESARGNVGKTSTLLEARMKETNNDIPSIAKSTYFKKGIASRLPVSGSIKRQSVSCVSSVVSSDARSKFENANREVTKSTYAKKEIVSCLPVSGKLTKKPTGCVSSVVQPNASSKLENSNHENCQRSSRLPLRKLQEPLSYGRKY